MADHLDVDTEVLRTIASGFDETSRRVDELSLPAGVDGGIATADVLVLLSELSLDLADIAGGMDAMSQQLLDTRQLYLQSDEDAAEGIFLAGGGR